MLLRGVVTTPFNDIFIETLILRKLAEKTKKEGKF